MAKSEEELREEKRVETVKKFSSDARKKEEIRRESLRKAQQDTEKRNQPGVWSA